jgi:hypothetical protein
MGLFETIANSLEGTPIDREGLAPTVIDQVLQRIDGCEDKVQSILSDVADEVWSHHLLKKEREGIPADDFRRLLDELPLGGE